MNVDRSEGNGHERERERELLLHSQDNVKNDFLVLEITKIKDGPLYISKNNRSTLK